LTLTFSAAIDGLSADNITLTSSVSGLSIEKGVLSSPIQIGSNGNMEYTLLISDFTTGGQVSVAVNKAGFDISGSPKTVDIYYVPLPISVTLISVTANGSPTETTTQLTLNFDKWIGLNSDDITLSDIDGVTKGALSTYVPGSGTFTLNISNVTESGTLTVEVNKEGYNITYIVKTVDVYYDGIPIFNDIDSFTEWLAKQGENNEGIPYKVKLNVSTLGIPEGSDILTAVGEALSQNRDAFVSLDLSGSTFSHIVDNAFSSCRTLTSITISESVISIGALAFNFCINLTAINVNSNNKSYISADGVLYSKDKTKLIIYPAGKTGEFSIPSSVTSIGNYAFFGCGFTNVTIPDSVTSIGICAFLGCNNLTSVTFEGTINLENFADDAFNGLGDLRDKYFDEGDGSGGAGTYIASIGGDGIWTRTKQEP